MGTDKGLVSIDSIPVILLLLKALDSDPVLRKHNVLISIRAAQLDAYCFALDGHVLDLSYSFVHDELQDIGPAAGLLRAHEQDPSESLLVVAVDFMNVTLLPTAIRRLLDGAKGFAVTCYENEDGFAEPLFALWTPFALQELKGNVANGKTGPSYTLKRLQPRILKAADSATLLNVNTREDFDRHFIASLST